MHEALVHLLRAAREVWTLDELATRAEIDAPCLRGALRGDLAGWDTSMIGRLARVCGVDPGLVWRGEPLPAPRLLAFLRDRWGGMVAEDVIALRRALTQARGVREAALLPAHIYAHRRPRHDQAWLAGYEAARRVRRDLGAGGDPLVDLRAAVERELGVLLTFAALRTPGLEALAVADEGGAAILLNTQIPSSAAKRRRSVAHELCHLLFDPREGGPMVDVIEDTEGPSQSAGAAVSERERCEQRARAFAAELLIPEKGLRKRFSSTEDTNEARTWARTVCTEFGAPWQLALFHLANHRIIGEGPRDRLLLESWEPPTGPGLGSPAALDWLHHRMADGEISAGRVRDLFGLDYERTLTGPG